MLNGKKHNNAKTDTITSAVMGDMVNPHFNEEGAYALYVCIEHSKHPTIKSNLLVGLAWFDYSVLFTPPKGQAVGWYSRLLQSFCIRGWSAKELKSEHMDNYLEFLDDLSFVKMDEVQIAPKIVVMATFLYSSPELSKREYTSYVFKLCCLCLGHVVSELRKSSLGSPDRSVTVVDLADVIELLQSYSLNSSSDQNKITKVESLSSCVEILAEFGIATYM